ncbi:ABC transporter permease [Hathewaya histolytica]|uniref:Peptide ABC transporter permease n=1 Tax=Hathewaya histolytica TaxID=1498 RepID=A0A4U9RM48_HATHI|nr:ABC transporter permease [Hathewaya histolytica]VTQ92999.1 peptide ABC transporter permease [Hathewaya histolytica]
MFRFILKRLGYGIFTTLVIITLTFFLIHLKPGDPMADGAKNLPAEAKQAYLHKHGLDLPIYKQYFRYMKKLVFEFDLGESLIYEGRTVSGIISKHGPISATYGGLAILLEVLFGVTLGVIAAFKRGTWVDQAIGVLIILGICVPGFVLASLLQYVFSIKLKLVPIFGWGKFSNIILPAIAVSFGGMASYCKFMRNSTLSVIGEDYIITAKAKGVSKFDLVTKHVIRNAIIPIITFLAPAIMGIFMGGFVIERIFSIPGLGDNYVTAINSNDYIMIMGLTIFIAITYIIALILVDIFYGIADPRIRVGQEKSK